MAPALNVGAGFSPLDEELALNTGGGNLSPRLHEWLVRLSAWVPFEQAARLLADFAHIQVCENTARRLTEAAGAAYEAAQGQDVEEIERQLPEAPQGPAKGLLSVDGAMVPLLHGEWAEVKTLVLGEVGEPILNKEGEWVTHTNELSYFSRLADADTFGRLALGEVHRRGVESAQQVGAVMDGAEWQQGFVDYHRPDALRILDFAHAAERLSGIGSEVKGEGTVAAKEWLREQCHSLKHQGPALVLARLRQLRAAHPDKEILATNLAYLEKREGQMQYQQYQQDGWPIGSGVVESANKVVVQTRLKGAGMHWERTHVNPMLSLRNAVCNDRWAEAWSRITARLQEQARKDKHKQALHEQYHRRGQGQRQQLLATIRPAAQPQLALPLQPDKDEIEPKTPWRPAPDHPWRRSPIGRARFQTARAS